jgi:hypothetical protein
MLFLQLLLLTVNRLFYNKNKFGPLLTTYLVGTYAYQFLFMYDVFYFKKKVCFEMLCVCVCVCKIK